MAANDQNLAVSGAIYGMQSTIVPYGWQYTAPTTATVYGARLYTANFYISPTRQFMTIEIWDENAQGLPNSRLAGGTWMAESSVSWQGANLDVPVSMQAGTNYWIVFIEPSWSTVPIEPGGSTQLPSARYVGGVWNSINPSALKFRLFCQPLETPGAVPFGLTCQSSAGQFGSMFTNDTANLGNVLFRLEGTGLPANSLCFMVLGVTPNYPSTLVPGTNNCMQSTDAFATVVGTTGGGDVRSATALGHLAFPIPLPSSPSFSNFYFSAQLAALDVGSTGALPFVTTNAMQMTLF